MSILRMGSWIISRSSPAVLIASGAALALAVPAVRRGFRAALVTATKGALVISDEVKNLTEKVRVGASDIVEEARQTSCCPCPAIKSLRSSAKVKGRRMAVATTAGVLSIQEKAKSVQAELKGIVDEARQLRVGNESDSDVVKEIVDNNDIGTETDTDMQPDGLEASITEIGPDSPRKRHSGSKKITE